MASENTSIPSSILVKHPDILMSVGVVGILMVMLVPLPRFFLDLLLSFNITPRSSSSWLACRFAVRSGFRFPVDSSSW